MIVACCNVEQSFSGGSLKSCWELCSEIMNSNFNTVTTLICGFVSRQEVTVGHTKHWCSLPKSELIYWCCSSTDGLLKMDAASCWMLASRAAVTWQTSWQLAGFSTSGVWAHEAFLWLSPLSFCCVLFFKRSSNWKHEGHNTLKPVFVAGNHPSGPPSLISQTAAIRLSSVWSVERHPEIMRIIRSSLCKEDNFSAGCTK